MDTENDRPTPRQAGLEAERRSAAARGEKPAWKPKTDRPTGDRPAWKPKSDRPAGDRPAWKPKADGATTGKTGYRGAGTGGADKPRSSAPRGHWRGDRPGRDATPPPGGEAAGACEEDPHLAHRRLAPAIGSGRRARSSACPTNPEVARA